MLILFDIDGTLLLTQRAGILAMNDAGRELFGDDFSVEGVEFSGRLDPLIWRDLATANNVEDHESHHPSFRAAYGKYLERRLNGSGEQRAYALPGVAALIEDLKPIERITLGLLTGNYPETGEIKLRAAGLDPDAFSIRAWGIDGPTRRDLPCVAVERYAELKRGDLAYESVIIIGDTPHDVDCARAHRCRSIGVATGAYSIAELKACGADLALADLSETRLVLDWIVNGEASCSASPRVKRT